MTRENSIRVQHAIVGGAVLENVEIGLDGQRFGDIRETDAPAPDAGWLIPGFVDTHCHGAAGADFSDPDPRAVRRAIDYHRAHGSTTLFASTVTASVDELIEQVRRLRPWVESGDLAGIHLEGPWLAPARKGAHDPARLRDPDPADVRRLLDAGGGAIRMVTLAPELSGAAEAAAELRAHGVVVAFGHSDADATTTRACVESGMTVATHLFNAMRPVHHRDPGPVPVLLHDPRVLCEMICDGVHVAPEVMLLALDAAGRDRIALVTDAMSATGCPDGAYELGRQPVVVDGGVARIAMPDGSPGPIAGSTLTMDRAFTFLIEHGVRVADAARMSSTNAARVHGLSDVGTVEPGAWADACLVDDAGRLLRVLRRGRWLSPDLTHRGSAA